MATYEAIGGTLEEAVAKAHDQIGPRQGRDYAVSRVVTWGMQTGGFVPSRKFYAVVEEDPDADFRTDPAPTAPSPPPPGIHSEAAVRRRRYASRRQIVRRPGREEVPRAPWPARTGRRA